jgi:endo-1,4-beta-xylanase
MARVRGCAVAGITTLLLMAGPLAGGAGAAPAKPKAAGARHVLSKTPPPPRRVLQGTAVRLDALRRDPTYRDTFVDGFDALTPENEMKMAFLQPRRGVFDFRAADELVAFAKRNHKQVHGHALVWGLQLPLWLIDHGFTDNLGLHLPPIDLPGLGSGVNNLFTAATGWSRDELLAIMKNHIDTVMRHFGDDVPEWDVVNEPMDENGNLADNVWRHFIGDDYIDQALRAARAANPRARLFINDYSVEGPTAKRDGLLRLVRNLKARGVPLDGVGLQYHTNIKGFYDQATLQDTIAKFAALGVKVEITEMDVGTSILDGPLQQRLARQALAYGAAARACNAEQACTRFTTWGFSDRQSWLGDTEMALPLDTQYRPKPAFEALRDAFASASARSSRRLGGVVGAASGAVARVRQATRAP